MLFNICLSITETMGYYKGQPTPYSNRSKNVAFAKLYDKDTTFYKALYIVVPQNELSDSLAPFSDSQYKTIS